MRLHIHSYQLLIFDNKKIPTVFMELESIPNKLSNLVKNMRGYSNTSPLSNKSLGQKSNLKYKKRTKRVF